MRRSVFMFTLALGLAPAAAPADVTASGTVEQRVQLHGSGQIPDGYVSYDFGAVNAVEADGDIVLQASASLWLCDAVWNCSSRTFPAQAISPTAFRMDPIGNSGTFSATLASSDGPSGVFQLTFSRPAVTWHCAACTGVPNIWVDPATGEAGATAATYQGLTRGGYTVSGSFAGSSMAAITPPFGMRDHFYSTNAFLSAAAIVP